MAPVLGVEAVVYQRKGKKVSVALELKWWARNPVLKRRYIRIADAAMRQGGIDMTWE